MPRANSADLRERALAAREAGEGRQSEVARRYRIGERTLSAWPELAREEGRRHPEPRRGGRGPLGGEREALAALVAERSDAALAERADRLAERAGAWRSPSALCRALKALGLVRKKRPSRPPSGTGKTQVGLRPPEGRLGAEARRAELAGVDPARLVFIDETGIDARMTRALRPRRQGAARPRQVAPGAVGAAGRPRRARARRRGRQPGRRRRDRHGGLPRLRRGGPDPGTARPAGRARGDGRPRRPQGREEGARGPRPGRAGPPLPPRPTRPT